MAFNSYMHERNIYRNQPDFTKIALDFPAFRKYAIPDAKGKKVRVDFTNPEALRMVTEILLKKDFNLDIEIPKGFLIPTVPQRLNYILWLEDLLTNVPGEKKVINGIDIGTGPCAIFSILGARKNNWNFVATENCDDAIHWAKTNISKNDLEHKIKVMKVTPGTTLSEILSSNEDSYDFCLCNPPFFGDIEEIRKKNPNSDSTIADLAREKEIFCQGGEFNFVKNILNDSLIYKDRVCLFTSMCGKKKSFLEILKEIKEIKEAKVTTTEFCQGNTVRWGIAWTFNKSIEFDEVKRKLKPQKAKPPLEYQIPLQKSKDFNLQILVDQTESFLKLLKIPHKVTKSSQYFTEFLMKSDENTWTHQRRKRREMQRQKKETNDLETQSHVSIKKEIFDSSTADAETLNSCDSSGKSHDLLIKSEQNDDSLMRTHEHSVIKMETELNSIDQNKSKISTTDEVDCKHSIAVKDPIRNETDFDSHKKIEDIQTQQGSVLYCHLQLIKGKGKVYVKMNCPPNADRNTMYQVFQLIKNKIK